jgi:hypothetical protein
VRERSCAGFDGISGPAASSSEQERPLREPHQSHRARGRGDRPGRPDADERCAVATVKGSATAAPSQQAALQRVDDEVDEPVGAISQSEGFRWRPKAGLEMSDVEDDRHGRVVLPDGRDERQPRVWAVVAGDVRERMTRTAGRSFVGPRLCGPKRRWPFRCSLQPVRSPHQIGFHTAWKLQAVKRAKSFEDRGAKTAGRRGRRIRPRARSAPP